MKGASRRNDGGALLFGFRRPRAAGKSCRALLLWGLFFSPVAFGGEAPRLDPAATLIENEYERRCDFDACAASLLALCRQSPDRPEAEVALRQVRELFPEIAFPEKLQPELAAILGLKKIDAGARQQAVLLQARLLQRAGENATAKELLAQAGFLVEWLFAGPFGPSPAMAFDMAFPPEQRLELGAQYPDLRGAFGWRAWAQFPGPDGTVSGFSLVRPRTGVTYLLARLENNGGEKEGFLHLFARGSARVWFGGRMVIDADRARRAVAAEVVVPVHVPPGFFQVLVKVSADADAFSLRLFGEDGLALPGLSVVSGLEARQAAMSGESPKATFKDAGELLPRAVPGGDKKESARRLGVRGMWLSFVGRHEEAGECFAEALEQYRSAALLYQAAVAARRARAAGFSPFSPGERAERAYLEECLKVEPEFTAARLALARLGDEEGQPRQALGLLETALKSAANPAAVRQRLAELALERNWLAEARQWALEAEKLQPGRTDTLLFWGNFYRKTGDARRARENLRRALENDRSNPRLFIAVAGLEKQLGDYEAALETCRRLAQLFPGEPEVHREIARGYWQKEEWAGKERAETYPPVMAAFRRALELLPREAALHQEIGDFLLWCGRRQEALWYYEEALRRDPSRHALRRYLCHERGQKEPDAACALEVADLLAQTPDQKYYPGCHKIRVIDQTLIVIYPDGSYTEFTHNAEKILTEEGVKRLSEVYVPGECLEARVYRPGDGRPLEPTVLPQKQTLTMPGLEPGAVVEWKYRQDHNPALGGHVYLPGWYFISPGLDEPHQISQYLIVVPWSLAGTFRLHESHLPGATRPLPPGTHFETRGGSQQDDLHFDVEKEVEHDREKGVVVYKYTARRMGRINTEERMPHINELLPYVEAGTYKSPAYLAAYYRSLYAGRAVPTAAVRRAAREALAEAKDFTGKIRALCQLVQTKVPWHTGFGNAHSALTTGAGDRHVLLLALLRAAGLRASLVRAMTAWQTTQEGCRPNWELLQESSFPHTLVAAYEGAKPVWLDLDNRFLPWGVLGLREVEEPEKAEVFPQLAGGTALLLDEASIIDLPAPSGPTATSRTELSLARDGTAVVAVTERFWGALGAAFQQRFVEQDANWRENWLAERLAPRFPGLVPERFSFPGLGEHGHPFTVTCSGTIPGFAQKRAGELFCSLALEPLGLTRRLAARENRHYDLRLWENEQRRDEVHLALDPHLSLRTEPENTLVADDIFKYTLALEKTGRGLQIVRTISLRPQVVPVAKYRRFRENCLQVDRLEGLELRFSLAEGK